MPSLATEISTRMLLLDKDEPTINFTLEMQPNVKF